MTANRRYVGIDVQTRRGCSYVVLDPDGAVQASGWLTLEGDPVAEAVEFVTGWTAGTEVEVGIDAPRQPVPELRRWQRDGDGWRRLPPEDGKRGRHCELVLSTLGIANPQWTPLERDAPDWMRLGFELYRRLSDTRARLHEVFPTASYAMLARTDEALDVTLPYAKLRPGVKDLIDALVAADTVRRFGQGQGTEVGGGDDLGTIVLPTGLGPDERAHPVHEWPGDVAE